MSGGFSPSMLDAIRHAMQASRAFYMKLKEEGQKSIRQYNVITYFVHDYKAKGIVDYKPITLDEALYMATIGGAKGQKLIKE